MGDDAAPGRLILVQELTNSFDVRRGRDELAGPPQATGWLRSRGLIRPRVTLTVAETTRLDDLRQALRRMCLANNGVQLSAVDIDMLNAVARDAELRPVFAADGVELLTASSGAVGALGRIVAIVHDAIRDGSWRRLKACPEDACNYTFYDTSRNGSRVWCSMAGCGSKVKMRAYRARVRTAR